MLDFLDNYLIFLVKKSCRIKLVLQSIYYIVFLKNLCLLFLLIFCNEKFMLIYYGVLMADLLQAISKLGFLKVNFQLELWANIVYELVAVLKLLYLHSHLVIFLLGNLNLQIVALNLLVKTLNCFLVLFL